MSARAQDHRSGHLRRGGPGDPGLLTVRAAEALRSAALILRRRRTCRPGSGIPGRGPRCRGRPAIGDPASGGHARRGGEDGSTVGAAGRRRSVPRTRWSVRCSASPTRGVPFDVVPGVPARDRRADVRGIRCRWAPRTICASTPATRSTGVRRRSSAPGARWCSPRPRRTSARSRSRCWSRAEAGRHRRLGHGDGTGEGQQRCTTTLAALEQDSGWLSGPLVVTVGQAGDRAARLSWWETRPLYGWKVLVPAHQGAGRRDERRGCARTARCRARCRRSRSSRRARPAQMERAIKGLVDGRYAWVVFTSTNAVRAVWEKFDEHGLDARAFGGVKIACVGEATADAVRAFGIQPELVPAGEQSQRGPAGGVLAVRRDPRPGRPGAAAARRHRHRDAGGRADRARLGGRRRHRLPDRPRRTAAGRDPRRDQVGRLRRGAVHLVLDRAQPGRHRRQAARRVRWSR